MPINNIYKNHPIHDTFSLYVNQLGVGKVMFTPKKLEFEFHNVGQGLFYSGRINEFRFIYDCGSKSNSKKNNFLAKAIQSYKEGLGNKKINLLAVSHFHADHINGLNSLLNNLEIEEVIIPYYTPIERLIIAVAEPNSASWYYQFLSDPINFLLDRGVKKIVVIRKKEKYEYIYDLNQDLYKKEVEIKYQHYQKDIERLDNGSYEKYWEFIFFYYSTTIHEIDKFRKILFDNNINLNDKDSLLEAMKKPKLKILKDCYKKINGKDLNNSSLIMYHGPVKKDTESLLFDVSYTASSNQTISPDIINFFRTDVFGHLLTGDINLNYEYYEIKNYYKDVFENVLITQIPHHGSVKSWNTEIFSEMPYCILWVASTSLSGQYRHPHPDIIIEIHNKGKLFGWSNELCKILIKANYI